MIPTKSVKKRLGNALKFVPRKLNDFFKIVNFVAKSSKANKYSRKNAFLMNFCNKKPTKEAISSFLVKNFDFCSS